MLHCGSQRNSELRLFEQIYLERKRETNRERESRQIESIGRPPPQLAGWDSASGDEQFGEVHHAGVVHLMQRARRHGITWTVEDVPDLVRGVDRPDPVGWWRLGEAECGPGCGLR